jgi:hypothetical protein
MKLCISAATLEKLLMSALLACLSLSVKNVFTDSSVEEKNVLLNDAYIEPERFKGQVVYVLSVNEDFTRLCITLYIKWNE